MSKIFGERLAKVIKELGFSSQNKFAEEIDEQQSKVSRYVRGDGNPGFEFLEKLALKFPNLSMRYLIGGQGAILDNERNTSMDTEIIDIQKEEIESLNKLLEVQMKKVARYEQEIARLKNVVKE